MVNRFGSLRLVVQERDEWVAELRVASRVVPLEDIFELKALLRKGAFASVRTCNLCKSFVD